MNTIKRRFSTLYESFAKTPELAKFNRYLELWCWILYSQSSKIETQVKKCNGLVADIRGVARENSIYRVTDFPLNSIVDEHPELKKEMEDLQSLVRSYSSDLLTAENLAKMHGQRKVHAQHFANMSELFEGGLYGPTQEKSDIYSQVPSHPYTASLLSYDPEDPFTDFIVEHLESMNTWYRKTMNWIMRRKEDAETEAGRQEFIALDTVRMIMNLLAGLYAPCLFAGSLAALSCIDSEKLRIVVLGAFACVLAVSLVVMVPTLKRNEIFSITVAYFAVGGIYIGAKSMDYRLT